MPKVFKLKFHRTRDGVRRPYTSRNYYAWINGKRISLSPNKAVAEQLLGERIQESERRKHGLVDRFAVHRKAPLREHVEKFGEHLEAKGDSPRYVAETLHSLRLATAGCHFLGDVTADRINAYLRDLDHRGRSPTTLNAYLTAAKNFCKWCVRTSRAPDNPLAHLSKRNTDVDVRCERRTITADEFAKLITAAEASADVFRRLAGPDRAMLYLVAVGAGLRAGELASLTTNSLALEGDPPIVTVAAAFSKRRRKDQQPIPDWLADRLRTWLADRRAVGDVRLWPGSWAPRAAEMLRIDLEAAGIDYRDADGRVFDFHALRHQYISNLAEAGVHPRTAQQLARHSSIELTMKRYTHLSLSNVAGAVDTIPEPRKSGDNTLAATGTDDRWFALVARQLTKRGQKCPFPVDQRRWGGTR